MPEEDFEIDQEGGPLAYNKIHRILAHSYLFYLILFVVGVTLDIVFRVRIFPSSTATPVGVALLILASLLIIWAQHTSRNLHKENISKESFLHGPYCYTRTPTHWGLFLLVLGFGIVSNAFFIMLLTVISFIITKFFFLKKEEEALVEKYGRAYSEYQKKVKL